MDEGYSKIAWRMSVNPGLTTFRRFHALSNQNLLYLQAELTHLEYQFGVQAETNARSGERQRQLCSRDWLTLKNAHAAGAEAGRQWAIFLEFRSKLKEYHEALAHHAFLSGLSKPQQRHREILRSCLQDEKLPDFLLGRDKNTWADASTIPDLVSLHREHDFDMLSRWLVKLFLGLFHRLIGPWYKGEADGRVYHYDDYHLQIPASIVSTVLACLMPVGSIVVLHLVKSTSTRLGIIAGFTAAFSLTLALVTRAKRVDIFAATAAFAAVQVVFIGTN